MDKVREYDPDFGELTYDPCDDVLVREIRRTQAMQRKTYLLQLQQAGVLKSHRAQIVALWGLTLVVLTALLSGGITP